MQYMVNSTTALNVYMFHNNNLHFCIPLNEIIYHILQNNNIINVENNFSPHSR